MSALLKSSGVNHRLPVLPRSTACRWAQADLATRYTALQRAPNHGVLAGLQRQFVDEVIHPCLLGLQAQAGTASAWLQRGVCCQKCALEQKAQHSPARNSDGVLLSRPMLHCEPLLLPKLLLAQMRPPTPITGPHLWLHLFVLELKCVQQHLANCLQRESAAVTITGEKAIGQQHCTSLGSSQSMLQVHQLWQQRIITISGSSRG